MSAYLVYPGDAAFFENATNKIGFDAYPAGARQLTSLVPQGANMYGYRIAAFWTSTEKGDNGKYFARIIDPSSIGNRILRDTVNGAIGFSVRCVQDGSSNSNSNPTVEP